MFSTVLSAALQGLQVEFIDVEADLSNGLPMFHMVGYLSSEVKEAGERVRTAIRNSGLVIPAKKIVVNLSPADVRKRGTAFDLPIAVSILASLGVVSQERLEKTVFVGELSLDGRVRSVPGILPIVLEAKKHGFQSCVVSKENESEGKLVEGIEVIGVENLKAACDVLNEGVAADPTETRTVRDAGEHTYELDYQDIKGQKLAKRIPTILPPLTKEESMELTKLYSIVGGLNANQPLILERPFREVHHTTTTSALIGGGLIPRPGEISLADKGVLFLDEIAEFQKPVLEMLRQPLEEHFIKIIRNRGVYHFPAEFLLVAAMNPCPCGNYPDLNKCLCTSTQIQAYLSKISQPLLDRIDICVEAERVAYEDLQGAREESSKDIRERVIMARERQKERYKGEGITTNSQLNAEKIKRYCILGSEEEKMMRQAFEKLNLTARMYHKILCVARTIADLAGEEKIGLAHLREAIGYRTLDKKYWGR